MLSRLVDQNRMQLQLVISLKLELLVHSGFMAPIKDSESAAKECMTNSETGQRHVKRKKKKHTNEKTQLQKSSFD